MNGGISASRLEDCVLLIAKREHLLTASNAVTPQKGQAAKKQAKRRDSDRFDSLVAQYKKKLLSSGGTNAPLKRNKWFDS